MCAEAGNRRVPSDASTICQHGLQESFSKDPRCGESDPRDHSKLREVRLRVGGLAQTLGTRHSRMEPDVVEARRQAVTSQGRSEKGGRRARGLNMHD